MIPLLIVVHIVVCVIMILIVLLQGGKGAEMGAAFGGASQTVFGSSGPTDFLGRLTTWSAAIFMMTSLTLAYLSSGKTAPSVVDKIPIASEQQAEETPLVPEGIDKALPPMDQGAETTAPPAPPGETAPAPETKAE
jgi:preprotein translocase subunit SecG